MEHSAVTKLTAWPPPALWGGLTFIRALWWGRWGALLVCLKQINFFTQKEALCRLLCLFSLPLLQT